MLAVRRMAMAWLLMLVPALAVAQASAPAANPLDPMNPQAPVPALPDLSPLAGYLPYQAPTITPWRQSNADVAPAGKGAADPHAGHRMNSATPARPTAQAPASAPVVQPDAPVAPAADPHAGHHQHAH